ncbi:response regulator [Massilia niabensis]|uniref:histidine kinase n=1 Tax=Massilia niabensis TaxID=544910 RepID=A0ABW0L7Q7_9BURK
MSTIVWPACGGATAALVRSHDWSNTSLGATGTWPQALRSMVDMVLRSPVAMVLAWGEDRVLIYNDAYAGIAGARHPAVFGRSVFDAWPETRDFNVSVYDACFAGREQVFHDQHLVLDRDGEPGGAWFDLYYTPVVDGDAQIRGVLTTVIETTARVQGERQRACQEEHLRRVNADLDALRVRLEQANRQLTGDMDFLNGLFRQAPSFMAVVTGPDHVFELANDSYLRLVQQRQVVGKPVRLALPEVVEQGYIDVLDRVRETGEPFHGQDLDVRLDSGNGTVTERRILDFVFQPLKDATGKIYGIFIEGVDITDHALTEERLRVAQEAGEIGTFEWYPATGEVIVSEAYRRLWGFAPDVKIDANLLLGQVDPAYAHLAGPSRLGSESNPIAYAEFVIIRADTGERRWIARRGQPVASTVEGVQRYLGVAFDITDRKRTEESLRQAEIALRELNGALERQVVLEETERFKVEEALRQAQKMEAVGQLASGVAHDFNNVLQIISSNLQLMELDGVNSLLAARLASAVAAVERGSKLSSQLLAFARRQPLQPVPTHLGDLLAEMESLLARALGDRVEIALEGAADLWNVEVDRNQLENAILNMAINARDAMGGEGRLRIGLSNARPGGAPGGEQVCLSMTDSGCGMPPEVLAKIFDPFYTTKAPGKGTGLGMSMVYGFVKQSGGEIRIESRAGQGTTIRIYLPRSHGAALQAGSSAGISVHGAGETILVVDDDAAVVASTTEILEGLGYRVLRAGDGQQALAVLQDGVPVDLLFTDLSMPGAVDCAALVGQCRAIAPATRILLTSGHLRDGAFADGFQAGIELLPKPYSRSQLAQAVLLCLGSAGTDVGAGTVRPAAAPFAQAQAPEVRDTVDRQDGRTILVVEDDADTRELACELLGALGHAASGSASAEQALALLQEREIDVLFTDLNLPGLSGIELATRALALRPSLKVILASGEGGSIALPEGSAITLLPKPYDLLQLQLSIADLAAPPAWLAD